MRAEPPRREERAFDVRAEDPRAAAALGDLAERGDQPLLGRGDQGGQVGGDAGLEQRLAGARVAVGVRVEEVDAAEAVHLEVDEAGRGDARGRSRTGGRRRRSGRRRPRRRRGRARRRRARRGRRASRVLLARRGRRRLRRASRARASRPRRRRGARRSRPSRRRPRRRAPASTCSGRDAGRLRDDRPLPRARSFSFDRRRRRPSGSRRSCRAGSSRSSRPCSGRASGPSRPSGGSSRRAPPAPTGTHDLVGRRARRARSPSTQTTQPVSAPRAPRGLERAAHVGRAAAGADPDDGVCGRDAERLDRPRARRRRRPRPLPARRRWRVAPGEERDDAARLDRERRLALDRVEGGEAAGCSGADVDQASAERRAGRRRRRPGRRSRRGAPATAAGTVASSAFISSTSSAVERRSRSAPAASRASVPSWSNAVIARQCTQTRGRWSIPFLPNACRNPLGDRSTVCGMWS